MARGDHFFVWRRYRGFPFQHHAIDVGDGTIIHFTDGSGEVAGPGGDSDQFRIQRTSIDVATRGGRSKIHVIEHPQRLSADAVVARAISQCGRGGYHLLFDNCEHFACWCVADRYESRQVSLAGKMLTTAAMKALAATANASTKLGAKRLAGVSPWMLLADAAQWVTEATGHHVGLRNPSQCKRAGQAVGVTAAVGLGACAGPAGAAVSGGLWMAAELASELSQATYQQVRQRRQPEDDSPSA